jgi:hypothetical protein
MTKHLRHVLSWPLIVLQFLVAYLFQGFGWVVRMLYRLQRGGTPHVYWPIVVAKRIVRGEHRWQVQDCLALGIQPKTDEERARADADTRLLKLSCVCGKPNCATNGAYIGRDSS